MSKPHNQNSQRQQQDRRLFRIFNYYRVLLSLTLLFTYSNEVGKVFIGLEYPLLFIATTLVYTAINIALALVLLSDQPLQPQQIALNILIDILALSLLTYANGGVGSGFGILIILSIAAGSILMRGRHAVLFAAISSIAMLALESYRASTDALTPNYFQAGVLGMVFFATALFVKRISLRIDASEDLATQEQCVRLFDALERETNTASVKEFARFAVAHRDVIARFGRFPHRNAILGRASTADELAYLERHGGF